jgi:hypothetical protein
MSKKNTTKSPTYITTSKSTTYIKTSGPKTQTLKNLRKSSTSSVFTNEEYFKIIHELLRAKLLHVAPNFYSNYCRKLLEKILKEGKKMIKTASPGKFKTLKGQPSLPKYPKRLALIRDAVLSDKSPQELYDWWSQKIDAYGMSAQYWHFTWPEIECGFYNQLTHLSNSFNKYPPHDNVEGQHELQALTEYLKLVEEILQTTISGEEKPNYMLMMDAQIAYIRLTQIRHTGSDECQSIKYLEDLINSIKDKPILLLPQSIFGNVNDFIKFYGIPVVPFLSVYKVVHNGIFYDPCSQIRHDLQFHSDKYIQTDLLKLDYTSPDEIKSEFLKRTNIINDILSMKQLIDDSKNVTGHKSHLHKVTLAQILFEDLHEEIFESYKEIIIRQNNLKLRTKWYDKIIQMYELITKNKNNYIKHTNDSRDNEDIDFKRFLYEEYILQLGNLINNTHLK